MAVYHADAIVIRSREYGEADRILTIFARDKGKIQAIAKGVRKPKSRQRGGTQLFTYADFLLYRGKTLDTVSQVSPKESFPHLWNDLERSLAATGMAELLDFATFPEQPVTELFTLTITGFFLLEYIDPELLLCAYTLRLLGLLGYSPNISECAVCGEAVAGEKIFFSPESGGILCRTCHGAAAGKWLQAGSIAFMRHLLKVDISKLDRLRWNLRMQKEIKDSLQYYCEEKLERKLKSWSMGHTLISDQVKLDSDVDCTLTES